jgi:hypothetical protein
MDVVSLKRFLVIPGRWLAALATYAVVVGVTVAHHEPWFDEAQSWLLARDLSLHDLIFKWVRYEGTPPLWQVLLWIANRFHLPYQSMGWIAALLAIAGTFVFLKYSPFPWPVKLFLPFSYFFLYQYAVVARSYVLLPLLAFIAAALYKHAVERIAAFCAVLLLLANVSVHGTILSGGIAAAYAFDVRGNWSRFSLATRRRHLLAATGYLFVTLALVAIVWPPADGSFLHGPPPGLAKSRDAVAGALVGHSGVSDLILLICLCWCAYRRALFSLMLPMVMLLIFFAQVYVNVWHYGAITVCLVTALWIAWPPVGERSDGGRLDRWMQSGMAVVLSLVCVSQLPWTAAAVRYDFRAPYTGAYDAAKYIKSVGADQHRIYAYGFSSVALLPYFDRQIFANQLTLDQTAFWRWNKANRIDQEFQRVGIDEPDYLVLSIKSPEHLVADAASLELQDWLAQFGYSLVHSSPGALFWETKPWETDSYLIYHRKHQ